MADSMRSERLGPERTGDGTLRSSVSITSGNIDLVAETHFPLCMRRTLRVLRREHHLKYQARLQLVRFLANAGVEVRPSLAAKTRPSDASATLPILSLVSQVLGPSEACRAEHLRESLYVQPCSLALS